MKNDKLAIKKLINFNSNVSCHYYITKYGKLIQMVPDLYVAWHAGKSSWKKDKLLNYNSIGIEISNPGHEHGYKKFSNKQIKCLIKLLNFLIKKYKINKKNILGHSDVAPLRKLDPGENFPWKKLFKNKIGIWHNIKLKDLKKNREKKIEISLARFMFYLNKIGYSVQHSNSKELIKIIKVFQMRFRPDLVDGKLDLECYLIAKSLYKLN